MPSKDSSSGSAGFRSSTNLAFIFNLQNSTFNYIIGLKSVRFSVDFRRCNALVFFFSTAVLIFNTQREWGEKNIRKKNMNYAAKNLDEPMLDENKHREKVEEKSSEIEI